MAECDENNAGDRIEESSAESENQHHHPIPKRRAGLPPIPSFRIQSDTFGTPDSGVLTQDSNTGEGEGESVVARRPLNFGTVEDADSEEDGDSVDSEDENDDSSVSSSSLLEEEEEGEQEGEQEERLTLQEKATKNKQRHSMFLQSLNDKYTGQVPTLPSKTDSNKSKDEEEDLEEDETINDDPTSTSRGMLMPNSRRLLRSLEWDDESEGLPERVQKLLEKYPDRESQLRHLTSLLHATIGQVTTTSHQNKSTVVHVPAPIFILGPPGTGKTSVVCDVVETLERLEKRQQPKRSSEQQQQGTSASNYTFTTPSCVESAYINCATLEPSSIERLVAGAYNQLRPEDYKNRLKRRRKQLQKRKFKNKRQKSLGSSTKESDDTNTGTAADERGPNNVITAVRPPTESAPSSSDQPIENTIMKAVEDQVTADSIGHPEQQPPQQLEEADDDDSSIDRRIQPRRAAKKAESTANNDAKSQPTAPSPRGKVARGDAIEVSHSAVVAFGRSLRPFYGVGANRCAILILDHGERLLSLSARKSFQNEKTNFLAELLLLPKVVKLNLAIIVITSHSTLYGSRLNNLVSTGKSLATISNGVHPIIIQFPAYKGNATFKMILRTRKILSLVVGKHAAESYNSTRTFMNKAIEAFLTTLIQFISDSTRNLHDFIRLGRSLWPLYSEPLHPQKIEKTMEVVRKRTSSAVAPNADPSQDILAHLGQKFLTHIGRVSGDLTKLSIDSPMIVAAKSNLALPPRPTQQSDIDQPFLRNCLLLAAFVCQNNRPDQDNKVFSTHGNGRRKNRNRHSGNDEDVAFSSSVGDLEQLQSLRPRPFFVERVLSIFVTLVRLNPSRSKRIPGRKDKEETLESLGSTRLHQDLAQLVDLGHMHPAGFVGSLRGEQVNLSGAKFWCSLTREEALCIANKIGIPLDRYLV